MQRSVSFRRTPVGAKLGLFSGLRAVGRYRLRGVLEWGGRHLVLALLWRCPLSCSSARFWSCS
eukprot:4453185-Pyramimonas_sp.AAC.1